MKASCRILIADDHQIIIDGIKSLLSGTPYIITAEADNGHKALELINLCPDNFDMLITDISMPLLSGTELCKIIKQRFPKIKVLILSMLSSTPVVKEAVLAEADGFVLKNSGKTELLYALHTLMNDGTYYSGNILPILYNQLEKEKEISQNTAVLTERERQVLSLILNEMTSEQIAERLSISKKTVDNHRSNILDKTGCKSTIGLVKFALRNGIT